MNRTEYVQVRGTRYYEAPKLYRAGRLHIGQKVILEHHPFNPYDSNAVAVKLADTGEMVGHIPRELAPLYVQRIKDGRIHNAHISRAYRRKEAISIIIAITYSLKAINNHINTTQGTQHSVANAQLANTQLAGKPIQPRKHDAQIGYKVAIAILLAITIASHKEPVLATPFALFALSLILFMYSQRR